MIQILTMEIPTNQQEHKYFTKGKKYGENGLSMAIIWVDAGVDIMKFIYLQIKNISQYKKLYKMKTEQKTGKRRTKKV